MRETNAIMILRSKAARLRKETGNEDLRPVNDKRIPIRQLVAGAMLRPPKMLMSPIVLLLAFYLALIFGVAMLLFATFPLVFEKTYHWSVGVSGLAYIGVGVGAGLGLFTFARLSDALLRTAGGGPERRLLLMMWLSPTVPVGMILYGWTTYYKVHWIVPIIGTSIAGIGIVVLTSSAQTYVIDMFGPQGAASALAAITLLRSAAGAFLPLAAPSLYDKLGLGWGNSVLGFLALAFMPVPFFFYTHGEWLRKKFPVNL
jgi:MFS family permease